MFGTTKMINTDKLCSKLTLSQYGHVVLLKTMTLLLEMYSLTTAIRLSPWAVIGGMMTTTFHSHLKENILGSLVGRLTLKVLVATIDALRHFETG